MSGAEIAGFLLAGPPLIVSWLEHYRDVFQMLGCWRRFRNEYRKAQTQLEALELSFNLTLEKLFLPQMELSERLDEFERLKADIKARSWTEAEEKLRERLLPEVHKVYSSLLQDLQDAMGELEKALAYNKQRFQHEVNARQGVFAAFNTAENCPIIFSIISSRKGISQCNSLQMEVLRQNESNRQAASTRMNFLLRTIYERERATFSRNIKPREAAIAKVEKILDKLQSLLVQNDEIATARAHYFAKSKTAVQSTLIHFWKHAQTVYVLLSHSWSCDCRHSHCVDLAICHRTVPKSTLELFFRFAMPLPDSSPWKVLPGEVDEIEIPVQPKPTAKVRFSMRKSNKSATAANSPADLPPIRDLCLSFRKIKAGRRPVGLLSEEGRTSGFCLTKPEKTMEPEVISLADLLRKEQWNRPQRKQRYQLAATIASSHLQLHSSEWLTEGWSKENVHIRISARVPDFSKVYLRKSFHNTNVDASAAAFDIPFATLGILLLELCFGSTLEESPFRQNNVPADLVADRTAAWEWADKVVGEAGERWAHAIDWCLGKWKVREADVTWRQDFYQAVVEPLRAEAELF